MSGGVLTQKYSAFLCFYLSAICYAELLCVRARVRQLPRLLRPGELDKPHLFTLLWHWCRAPLCTRTSAPAPTPSSPRRRAASRCRCPSSKSSPAPGSRCAAYLSTKYFAASHESSHGGRHAFYRRAGATLLLQADPKGHLRLAAGAPHPI